MSSATATPAAAVWTSPGPAGAPPFSPKLQQPVNPEASISGGIRPAAWPTSEGPIERPDGFLQRRDERSGETELVFEMARGELRLTCGAAEQDAVDAFVASFLRFLATGAWEGGPAGPLGSPAVSMGRHGAAAVRGYVFSLGLTPRFAMLLLPYWLPGERGRVRERAKSPWASPQVSLLCQRLQRLPIGKPRDAEAGGKGVDCFAPPGISAEGAAGELVGGKREASLGAPAGQGGRPRRACARDPLRVDARGAGKADRKRSREGGGSARERGWRKRGKWVGPGRAWGAARSAGGHKRGPEGEASPDGARRAEARPPCRRRLR
ncbi:unnamed protein product [Ostreobium quekettii]|uniref:Uncharacterized protein n=1 Tax=Ostreobium quekettii TaxID=121088 RepID=A0A8S1IXX4_9CHLO|nr:unnamed protein product [Ostreobium quekettii]|eukprot:evm.model.scf_1728.4 EVM.evm.TU.scf_1728.4   scf_1728:25730-26695(+)